MTRPSLQLSRYFFVNIIVQANIDYDHKDKDNMVCNFNINPHLAVNKDNDNKYQLQLDISTDNETSKNPSYNIVLSVVGFFDVDPNFPEKEKLVSINGASILYGAAREFLLTITGRGPWPAVALPTFSFQPPKPDKEEPADKKVRTSSPRKKAQKAKKSPGITKSST